MSPSAVNVLDPADRAIVTAQLGRDPRGAVGVAWRCPYSKPGVVLTASSLPDGSPFPTTYYLTCPAAVKVCSTLEGTGLMAAMTARLRDDPVLARGYGLAHESYLEDRRSLGPVPEAIAQTSAGGMPQRVKCLHALVAHALAKGPGVNPLGDEVVASVGRAWTECDMPGACKEIQ